MNPSQVIQILPMIFESNIVFLTLWNISKYFWIFESKLVCPCGLGIKREIIITQRARFFKSIIFCLHWIINEKRVPTGMGWDYSTKLHPIPSFPKETYPTPSQRFQSHSTSSQLYYWISRKWNSLIFIYNFWENLGSHRMGSLHESYPIPKSSQKVSSHSHPIQH